MTSKLVNKVFLAKFILPLSLSLPSTNSTHIQRSASTDSEHTYTVIVINHMINSIKKEETFTQKCFSSLIELKQKVEDEVNSIKKHELRYMESGHGKKK